MSIVQPEAAMPRPLHAFALTILACAATAALATPLHEYLDLANIVMLFLLTVLIVAVKLGRQAAILASLLNVVLFDVFFVPPRFSLAISNLQYLVTFLVMLATGLITTHFTSVLRQKAVEAEAREQATRALYQLAKQLAGALNHEQLGDILGHFLSQQLAARYTILLPDDAQDALHAAWPENQAGRAAFSAQLARMAYQSGKPIHNEQANDDASLYLPLQTAMRRRGVLAIQFVDPLYRPNESTDHLLEALASLIAVALERLHYVEIARHSEVQMLTERLRSSILSALSHDLRTPLTVMVGLADSLTLIHPALPPAALESAQALREQSQRLAGLVGNLLDMARLNAGEVSLRREWHPLEEVIGSSIKLLSGALAAHPVRVDLPPERPLIEFDAVLLERVFCNLLENAAKYAPGATPIEIGARLTANEIEISVSDGGPGFPPEMGEDLFAMFVRGQAGQGKPGSGLGLAICKAIVEAHGGRIRASNRPQGGGQVSFTLPLGTPPVIEEELP